MALLTGGLLSVTPVGSAVAASQANYDEAQVPAYTLPDPWIMASGQPVRDARMWRDQRRPEILELFSAQVYGRTPKFSGSIHFETGKTDDTALQGQARRRQVRVFPLGQGSAFHFDLLLYLPKQTDKPAPAFLGLNFGGNHTIHPDPGIALSTRWMRGSAAGGVVDNRATEAGRGTASSRWPVEAILERGYALATVYCGDLEPDHPEGWREGIRAALSPAGAQTEWGDDDWGAIGAWAWGLSRALDYLVADPDVDGQRVAVMGHSRLGKTALWAGAQDERFAVVISNNSGEGGAALARRRFGETTAIINRAFPHWFCNRFKTYADRESDLPVDQHQLLALVAPRPLYVASASEDLWADPRGEFLSALHASAVYERLGRAGLGVKEMPGLDQPVGQRVGYHVRTGKHDVTPYDWAQYLNFADRHLQ
jgi:hypothetical protein